MTEVTIQDLITTSFEQKPIEFQNAFDALISGRIAQAIDNKKIEVAQSMFGGAEEAESDVDVEQEQEIEQEVESEEQQDGEAA